QNHQSSPSSPLISGVGGSKPPSRTPVSPTVAWCGPPPFRNKPFFLPRIVQKNTQVTPRGEGGFGRLPREVPFWSRYESVPIQERKKAISPLCSPGDWGPTMRRKSGYSFPFFFSPRGGQPEKKNAASPPAKTF